MRKWQMFTLAVSMLLGLLAGVTLLIGVVFIFMGAWGAAIALLLLAMVLGYMSASTKRSWRSMVGE
ncbi:hypothetical protein [Microbacterium sp. E-13]|uniref:hypothetical protein n=1 Tax=Microbacterium sp. E-13 TaxID=3404048 RepID=UPI003CEDFBA4